jgi:hypothetical protein
VIGSAAAEQECGVVLKPAGFGRRDEILTMSNMPPRLQAPLTEAGVASFPGVLASYEITVIGTLPEGKTTANVTYFVADMATNTIVGTVSLPDAVERKTAVSLTLKVPKSSPSFAIGTFEDGVFRVTSFLSVRHPAGNAAEGRTVLPAD